jgi:hypothetical protein
MRPICAFLLASLLFTPAGALWAQQAAPPAEKPAAEKPADKPATEKPAEGKASPTQEELEQKFADDLTGSVMVGNFTNGGKADKALKEERYTLTKVSKVAGDLWLFQTRIQYGDHDVTLPLAIQVKWAGDTPVITLTDFVVPGMGTFTARVLVYRNQYAGTWSGGNHGGHLFGRIVKEEKK